MEIAERNGVLTLWAQGPDTTLLRADLTFLSGLLHESLAERGSTEVIGEAVMAMIFRSGAIVDFQAAAEEISFYAVGSPTEVAASLVEISKALGSLSPTRLQVGRQRVPPDGHAVDDRTLSWVAHRIYGHTGVGRLGPVRPALAHLTDERILGVARRRFHRGVASLTFTGPPPDLSGFSLPEGTMVQGPASVPVGLPRPCVLRTPLPAAALALNVLHDAAGLQFLALLPERIRAALAAAPFHGYLDDPGILVSREDLLMTFRIDAHPGESHAAATILVDALRSLVDQPATAEDLANLADRYAARAQDPENVDLLLEEAGALALNDFGPAAVLEDGLPARDPERVRRVAQAALASMILLVPDSAGPVTAAQLQRWGGLRDQTGWTPPEPAPVGGTTLRRKRLARADGPESVTIGTAGITVHPLSGPPRTALWGELAGVAIEGERRTLHTLNGRTLVVDAGQLTRSDALLDYLDVRTRVLAWGS